MWRFNDGGDGRPKQAVRESDLLETGVIIGKQNFVVVDMERRCEEIEKRSGTGLLFSCGGLAVSFGVNDFIDERDVRSRRV